MAEPKVGMKYSSYLELGKSYESKSASAKIGAYERQQGTNPYDKVKVFTTTYLDKRGNTIGLSTLETFGNKQTSTFVGDSFSYSGEGSTYESDVKYTRINGTRTHAIDGANGCPKDGIVQQGEIMPNK